MKAKARYGPYKAGSSRKNKRTKVRNLVSFEKGNIRIFLRQITPFDEVSEEYVQPFLRLVSLVDGKYARLPLDKEILIELGGFLQSIGSGLSMKEDSGLEYSAPLKPESIQEVSE